MDLTEEGYLANVQCVEAWCPMTREFFEVRPSVLPSLPPLISFLVNLHAFASSPIPVFTHPFLPSLPPSLPPSPQEYLSVPDKFEGRDQKKVREVLYLMNPNKIRVCEYLMRYHEERGTSSLPPSLPTSHFVLDFFSCTLPSLPPCFPPSLPPSLPPSTGDKIIVFSDSVYALSKYAQLFGRDAIYGGTKESERERLLAAFRISNRVNTIFLSRVGDTSIDLPEANVIIQISSQFGSRRQEAQRLGRILRPKQTADEGFNAFFYTLGTLL